MSELSPQYELEGSTQSDFELLESSLHISHSVVSDCLQPHGLWPWNSPGKNTGVHCHFLSKGSSQPEDQTQVCCTVGRFFTI